jgi:hypothetical protein
MVGSSLEHAEELGVADLGTALGLDGDGDDDDGDDGRHLRGAVELGAVPHHGAKQEQRQQQQQPKAPPRAPRPAGGSGAPSDAGGSGRRDQSGAGAAPARLPLSSSASDLLQPPPGLPPVRTQAPEAVPPARFSLEEGESLEEVRLHSLSPPRKA